MRALGVTGSNSDNVFVLNIVKQGTLSTLHEHCIVISSVNCPERVLNKPEACSIQLK